MQNLDMKTIYDLATEAGILKDVQPYVVEDCLNISNIEKFASLIMDEIVATIEEEYILGDLSERTSGIRKARSKVLRRFKNI